MISSQQLAWWENIKALLARVVPDGVCYQVLKAFNTKYIHHYLGLYIFHVLSQSPQL